MVASCKRPKGVVSGPFGLSLLALSLIPTEIGYQDLAALLARQPAVSQRWRTHILSSPFGAVHAASFNFPRPLGTSIPEPPAYRLASLDFRDPDTTGSIAPDGFGIDPTPTLTFPAVNRRLKGDLLVPWPREPAPGSRDLTPGRVKTVSFPRPAGDPRATEPAQPDEIATPPVAALDAEVDVAVVREDARPETAAPSLVEPPFDPIDDPDPAVRLARLYFGNIPIELAPVSLDTTLSTGTEKEWPS